MRKEREQFMWFFSSFLEPSLLLRGQLRIDERVCWMMELFQPCWWLESLSLALTWNYGQQPGAHTARALCGQGWSTRRRFSSGSSNNTHINGLYGFLISIWTNRLLRLLLFDVFQGHSVCLAEWASTCHLKHAAGMMITFDFDWGLCTVQGASRFIFVYQCFSRGFSANCRAEWLAECLLVPCWVERQASGKNCSSPKNKKNPQALAHIYMRTNSLLVSSTHALAYTCASLYTHWHKDNRPR